MMVYEPSTALTIPVGRRSPGLALSQTANSVGGMRESDALQALAQLSCELASAMTLDQGASACLNTIEQCFAPSSAQLVWGAEPHLRAYSSTSEAVLQPRSEVSAALALGQTTILEHELWLPLMARGQALGWLMIRWASAWADGEVALATNISTQSGTALAMIEALDRQEERNAQFQTLAAIGQNISGVLDLEALMSAIHDATARVVVADDFFITLYEPDSHTFDLAYLAVRGERLHQYDRWSARVGLSTVVLRDKVPICTSDYVTECALRGVAPHLTPGASLGHAWLGVPLIVRDRVIGVMTVSHYGTYQYHSEHINLMTSIASQAAVAIENARLYRRSEQQSRQLETLNRIGRTITAWLDLEEIPSAIMDQVTWLLEVEEGSLLLNDETSGDLVFAYTVGPVGNQLRGQRLPRGTGIAGYVITSSQSIIVNDVQRDGRFYSTTDQTTGYTTRRLLAVPLRGLSGPLGVIEVLNRRDNSPFTDEDRRLLEALADYAVIAIENARRFAQVDQALARRAQELARINDMLQHNLRSLTALNGLGMAINSTLRSPDEIYRMTTRGVVEMTNGLAAWVWTRLNGAWRTVVTIGPPLNDEQLLVPLFQHVVETGRPELCTSDLPQNVSRIGARSLLIVPLRAPREILGCLCVAYADTLPDAPDRETVALFATQAASAVESMQLFSAVSSARDQMASVLASTREGILLVGSDRRVAVANTQLRELCGLESDPTNQTLEQFLSTWGGLAPFPADEWQALQAGLGSTTDRQASFVSGELNDPRGRVLAWSALQALSSGDSHGGALLVLREITEAKESEKLRQDLTHMIVHDLRSPLSSVMASVDMLMRGVTGGLNDSQQHVLTIASDSAQQMLAMINTLLDINRLEAGRMPLSLEQVDLCATIRRASSQLATLAHERNITIETDCSVEAGIVQADPALLVRVAQNLIVNAIKFSGRSGKVSVRVGQSPEGVLVQIHDQGIGIATKDRDKIFTKFGQVGERRGGTGLGLTFCKLVVETHGGRIWVDSQIGEGSTFSFIIPN